MSRQRCLLIFCSVLIIGLVSSSPLDSQVKNRLGHSFELIYFTPDSRFDGRTSFHDSATKPQFTTEQRIQYLQLLAQRLEHYDGQHFDEPVASADAVNEALRKLEPLPLPKVRKVQLLSHWKWQMDADGHADGLWSRPEFDDRGWNDGLVPLVREARADLWFRHHLSSVSHGRHFLDVEAAIDECWIWVNGQEVTHHVGYGPFRVEITKDLSEAKDSVISVRVKSKPGDQTGLGGRIRLITTGDTLIENVFAFTQQLDRRSDGTADAVETVQCSLANLSGAQFNGTLRVEMSHRSVFNRPKPSNSEITQAIALGLGETHNFAVNLSLEQTALWSPGNPNLYQVSVSLESNGHTVDDDDIVTGIRKIEQRAGRLYLNDRPFFMSGFLDMVTYPPQPLINSHSMIAPPDDGIVRSILTAKAAGANSIRIHPSGMRDTGAPTASGWPAFTSQTDATNYSRYAEIADQLGICLIWPTRFWGWQASFFEGDKEKQLTDDLPSSIRLVRNHPSIIFYEGMNEVGSTLAPEGDRTKLSPEIEPRVERYRKLTSSFVQTVHSVDPTRLISPDSGWVHVSDGPLSLAPYFADQATFNDANVYWDMHAYFGWYDPLENLWPTLARVSNPKLRQRPFLLTEFGSEAMPNWSRYQDQPWYGVWVNNARMPNEEFETQFIGRPFRVLEDSEFKLSQAYQAMLYQLNAAAIRDNGGDGMFACTLADGYAMGYYHKGAVDVEDRAKLGWMMARMVMQDFYPNGDEGDLIFGPQDALSVQVSSRSPEDVDDAALSVTVRDAEGNEIDHHDFHYAKLSFGAGEPIRWQPAFSKEGFYFVEYDLRRQ